MKDIISLPILESNQVGEARRAAVALASKLEFNETQQGKVALAIVEAAKNILKHAKEGELILRSLQSDNSQGIEIVALDRGAGMTNVSECLRDGFSTAGSPGTGLGAIKRLANFFDLYSVSEKGTALVVQLWKEKSNLGKREQKAEPLEIGIVNLPKPSEKICGDAWAVEHQPNRSLFLVADGLGSGPFAAKASQETVQVFRTHANLSPKAILEKAHAALQSTRGAAVAIAEIILSQEIVRFAGVGNIAGVILTGTQSRSMASYNGTIGFQVRKIEEFVYPWSARSLLIMHSDGLATQWSLGAYPGLSTRHSALIASVLYRDFKRSRDDVTVLVARMNDELPALDS